MRSEPWAEIKEQGIQFSVRLEELVTAGKRPQAPSNCSSAPAAYIALMEECWAATPAERPPFWVCLERLSVIRQNYIDTPLSDQQESAM